MHLEIFLGLGILGQFSLKNQTRKIVRIHKKFWTIISLHMIKCCNICKIFAKEMKRVGLKMSLAYVIIAHFESKIYTHFSTMLSVCLLNCFKYFLIYILRQYSLKSDKKNCQKNYIRSSGAKLLQILCNIFFGTKCLYEIRQERF